MILSRTTIRLNKAIYQRARRAAEAAEYSSVDEFVEHAVEKELAHREESLSKDELARKLKGLGYLE